MEEQAEYKSGKDGVKAVCADEGVSNFASEVKKVRKIIITEALNVSEIIPCLDEDLPIGLKYSNNLSGYKITIDIEKC
jgi:hypothetical protein